MPARRATSGGGARKGAGHGGAREGARRKRNVLPPDVVARLGNPPTDSPLQLARWYSSALSELLWLHLTTGKYVRMLREVKSAAGAIGRVMPMDVVLEAVRKVKDAEDELAEDELAEDEDPDEEARKVDRSSSRAVRRDAP